MNFNRYTKRVKKAMDRSKEIASSSGCEVVGSAHILLGIISVAEGNLHEILEEVGLNYESLNNSIEEYLKNSRYVISNNPVESKGLSERAKKVLEKAGEIANEYQTNFVSSDHILLAILKEKESLANIVIMSNGIDKYILEKLIKEKIDKSNSKLKQNIEKSEPKFTEIDEESFPVLDKYCKNLNKYVIDNNSDSIFGRDKELERIMQILNRRKKNNPILIGDPGVGKTAIVEGIARNISLGENITEDMINKRIYSLEIGNIIAGTKYRGEFEERIKNIIEEISENRGKVLLFIDEIHTLIGAGSTGENGSIDASNILKPALTRGDIQIIGATTIEEYRKYIEKDPALERRFQTIIIEEPDEKTSIDILKGLRDKYEAFHKVKITDEAIEKSVTLSIRYMSERFLPDKAIDVLDEACSRVKMQSKSIPSKVNNYEMDLKKIEKQIKYSIESEDFESAIELRNLRNELKKKIKDEHISWNKNISKNNLVKEDTVAEVLEQLVGVPIKKIKENEAEKLLNLENVLKSRIIGQDYAEKEVARAIRRSRTGIRDPKRPIGSFMFVGPSGVGKTELSKAIAESIFESEDNIIRLDMSEYMEKNSVSKLIGSPPGYVGYDEGGILTEKIRKYPYSVILFDEIEKAHPDMINILLQIIDDGVLTDSKGKKVNFKNTIIIMTSNIGYRKKKDKSMGFSSAKVELSREEQNKLDEKIRGKTLSEVKQYFPIEFLNRLDEIIVFRNLSKEDYEKIVVILSDSLVNRAKNIGIDLEITDSVYNYIAESVCDLEQGARPIKRIIQHKLTNRMSEDILKNNIKKGDKVVADIVDGKISFKKES